MKHTEEEAEKMLAALQASKTAEFAGTVESIETDELYHEAERWVMYEAAGRDYEFDGATPALTPDDFTPCATCGTAKLIAVPPAPVRYVESEHVGDGRPVKFFYAKTERVKVPEGDIPTLELVLAEYQCEEDKLTETVRFLRRLGYCRSITKDLPYSDIPGHVETPAFERSYLIADDIVDKQPKRLVDGIRTKLEILEESTVVPNGGHYGLDRLLRALTAINYEISCIREADPNLDIEIAIGRALHRVPELGVALFMNAGHVCQPYVKRLLDAHLPSDGVPVMMVPEKPAGEV